MVDVNSLFESLKAAWVPRILHSDEDEHWAVIPKSLIAMYGVNNVILTCNFNKKSLVPYIKRMPIFYQDVVIAFNKSKVVPQTTFNDNIFTQTIWGNRYIVRKVGNTKHTLYFKNWIDSGILYIGQLCFTDGKLDENYIYNVIRNKVNIFSEVSLLKQALKPYMEVIGNHDPNDYTVPNALYSNEVSSYSVDDMLKKKSKFFYGGLVQQINAKPINEAKLMEEYLCNNINFCNVYKCKVQNMPDKKLAEMNFKVLHGILPCNYNLKRWKKRESEKCALCNKVETISHLLYECNLAKEVWQHVSRKLNYNLDVKDIMFCENLPTEIIFVVSVVSFVIYKDWLIPSLEDKVRSDGSMMSRLQQDIHYYSQIYRFTNICNESIDLLEQIISA